MYGFKTAEKKECGKINEENLEKQQSVRSQLRQKSLPLRRKRQRRRKVTSKSKSSATKSRSSVTKKKPVTPKKPVKSVKKEPMKNETKEKKSSPPRGRKEALRKILLAKRDAVSQAIRQQLGQSLTDEQQRRLESAMDSGDQALVDLDREMGISLQEMRNKERQQIDDALVSLEEGTYGICVDCGEEIDERRLKALPFARLCVACQETRELMEKIERAEQRS